MNPRSSCRRRLVSIACCLLGQLALAAVHADRPLFRLPPVGSQPSYFTSDSGATSDTGEVSDAGAKQDAEDDETKNEQNAASVADRLDALEKQYEDLSGDQDDFKDSLKRYFESGHDGAEAVSISGRIHLDMWNFPGDSPGVNGFESGDPAISPQDRIGFRRIRFDLEGSLPASMYYKLEVELAGGNDVEYRDVYFGWEDLPVLRTLRLGNQKRPYGLDHLNSSRYNIFIERPFVIEGFNQDARRIGIASLGFSEDLHWNWRYGVYNQRLTQDEGNYISDHYQAQLAGRLANTFCYDDCSDGRYYAHWALSSTIADTDANADTNNFAGSGINEAQFQTRPEARTVERWLNTGVIDGADYYGLLGVEGVVNLGPWQWVGEYQQVWLERNNAANLRFSGGYFYLSYFLTGEHVPWNRETGTIGRVVPFENFSMSKRCGCHPCGWGAWQLAVRFSHADFADEDIQGGIGESVTAGLNWHWTPYAKMQLNYIYGNITNNALNAPAGAPDFGDYHIVGTRWLVDF